MDLRAIGNSIKPLSPISSGIIDLENEPPAGWATLKVRETKVKEGVLLGMPNFYVEQYIPNSSKKPVNNS